MDIETAGYLFYQNATAGDLADTFDNDRGRGGFIILMKNEMSFIKAWGVDAGPYMIACRDGFVQYRLRTGVSKNDARRILMKYLHHDNTYRTDRQWRRVDIDTLGCSTYLLGHHLSRVLQNLRQAAV